MGGTVRRDVPVGAGLVLTVAKVSAGGAAGYADYLDAKTQPTALGDYYLKDGERVEAPGRWAQGAQALGCDPERPVSGEVLRELIAVQRPGSRQPLRRSGGNGEAVAAIDATFSAPKSVSAVWALAGPQLRERIEAAHERAIDQSLSYATRVVAMIRERIDAETVVKTRAHGLIATSWRHTTARAVDGRAPDPQLHSHVLLHGALRRDGQVAAIDSRAWFVHRRELGAAYRTELARELSELRFDIARGTGRGGRYFEIAGVPGALIDRWSGRQHQVRHAINARVRDKQSALEAAIAGGGPQADHASQRLQDLRDSGRVSAGEDRLLTRATRSPKQQLSSRADLDREWVSAGRTDGLDPAAIEQLRVSGRTLDAAGERELLRRLTEFDATFTEREARAVALETSAGVGIDRSLQTMHQLSANGDLLPLTDGRHTTREHRRSEHQTVRAARELASGRVPGIAPVRVAEQAARLDDELRVSGGRLSEEQRVALELACSEVQLAVIEGQAGTGKSTVLIGVARAHQDEGRKIIVTSTAALAAQRLNTELEGAGVQADAHSTAALQAAIRSGRIKLTPETTVIHDEAALASTREQHQLLTAVQNAGARLILVGDPLQSQPVGPGGLWTNVEKAAVEQQVRVDLTRNVRALDPNDRRDQTRFREGRHEDAISGYHDRGRVVITNDQRRAEDAALDAAHTDFHEYRRTLVIAQTSNEHLDELNARAQAIRRENHELGEPGLDVTGRPYRLHEGDLVQVRHSIEHDTLRQIRNGQTGLVISVDPHADTLSLYLGHDRHGQLDRAQIDRADLRLAYVQHPFPAQGQTTDTVHVIVAEHATQEGTYVAITRARQSAHLYASHQQLEPADDPLPALAQHVGRTEPDIPSIRTPLAHEALIQDQQTHELTPAHPFDRQPEHADRPATTTHATEPDRDSPAPTATSGPPAWLIEALGARPDSEHPRNAAWQRAADAIGQYREDYNVPDDDSRPLGPEPSPGAFQQRLDRRHAAQLLADARDRGLAAALEPDDERRHSRETPPPERTIADRDGWEP